MYRALRSRDPRYDGVFFAAVKTTSIFCRPTCPAKKPRPENVEWFARASDALHAGYRPCLRCRPLDASPRPDWVAGLLARIEERPLERVRSADLRAAGIEPERARRWFRAHYGMTFHSYARARRLGLALRVVREGGGVTGAAHRVGFESVSGFRDAFRRLFGSPPAHAADRDALRARWLETPLGAMLAVASDAGLVLLEFVDLRALAAQVATLQRWFRQPVVPGNNGPLASVADELARYFRNELTEFTVPLDLRGSPFQLAVWRRLLAIPSGALASYAQIARDVGAPRAMRAIGRANGDNRIAIVVPCHRVVRADGTLCGYGGGVWRKRWLLEHEGAALAGEENGVGTIPAGEGSSQKWS